MSTAADNLIGKTKQALAGRIPERLQRDDAVPAAVLILLYEKDYQTHVVLTERSHDVQHHKGQIAFPGGSWEPEDPNLQTTALRETFEEVGVLPGHVELVGQLDDIYTVSNFVVTPMVGLLTGPVPYPFVPLPREVATVLEVPLPHLMDERNVTLEQYERAGQAVLLPTYAWNEYRVWGATAVLLQKLLGILES